MTERIKPLIDSLRIAEPGQRIDAFRAACVQLASTLSDEEKRGFVLATLVVQNIISEVGCDDNMPFRLGTMAGSMYAKE